MLSKSQISFVRSLHQKKFRREENLFIAEGVKVVSDLLSSKFEIKKVFATESFFKNHYSKKIHSAIEWIEVAEAELKKISSLTTPNEVLAIATIPLVDIDESEIKDSLNLVLDDISDPGNLGTIIRIADWFGIKNIICSNDTTDCYNPKVVQAAMGSLFRVKVHYTVLKNFFDWNNQNIKAKVFGTTLSGENIYSSKLSSNGLIVLGNESKGVHDDLKKYFTHSLFIPSFSSTENKKEVDSLNVAVAAAIVCSEFRRRDL